MAVKVMGWALEQRLAPGLKLMLVAIADHASANGRNSYASYATLAAQASVSRRTAMRLCAQLEAQGLVKIRRRRTAGRNSSNVITVLVPWRSDNLSPPEEDLAEEVVSHETPGGDTSDTPVVSHETPGGDTAVSPEPSLTVHEPNNEPKASPDGDVSAEAADGGGADSPERIQWAEVQAVWNSFAAETGCAGIREVSDERKRQFRVRLARWRKAGWSFGQLLERAREAKGAHGRTWFDFDFLIKNDRGWVRLIEGKYDRPFGTEGGGAGPPRTMTRQQSNRRAARTFAARAREAQGGAGDG